MLRSYCKLCIRFSLPGYHMMEFRCSYCAQSCKLTWFDSSWQRCHVLSNPKREQQVWWRWSVRCGKLQWIFTDTEFFVKCKRNVEWYHVLWFMWLWRNEQENKVHKNLNVYVSDDKWGALYCYSDSVLVCSSVKYLAQTLKSLINLEFLDLLLFLYY